MTPFPPAELACPDPAGCPVAPALPAMPGVTMPAGTPLFRCYDPAWGYDEFNPGFGDTRFAPFDDDGGAGARVPALYVAGTEIAALLETIFHEVHHRADRHIYERALIGRALAHLTLPRDAYVADLRDPALRAAGLTRDAVVASDAEHYPCTRRLAAALHTCGAGRRPIEGIVWHSRQAELLAGERVEVGVLFGDRYGTGRGRWGLRPPCFRSLFEGPGRVLVDRLAEALGATIHPRS